ncbi:MAG: DUF5908 family protein [Cytophagaceae bacterium]
MAIEIKELLVKITVNEPSRREVQEQSLSIMPDQKKIIEECVNKVLEILETKSER